MPPARHADIVRLMRARREVRAADHGYCGEDCSRGAVLATARLQVEETCRMLRALRRAERAGLLGMTLRGSR
jgi:hypothetical protein